ncbi:trypsin-like serine protease [Vibrio scophthalmi]|uniref:Peptidase S1 domain-containing protein n=1 Tax=Vibrio scophthalmi TaxID=45658 RepID=A0A1C7FHY6_9VIBR|nr:trypsin-like serine protease [Vibrio scophthalmi]ANU39398.1 hypothetical protein VSVS05_04363 [Vibrio scophthalmi]
MRRSFMLLALLSSSTFAAVDGTSVNWLNYKDMVNNNCTGTLIGGKFILTAAHCNDIKNTVITQDGAWINPTVVNDHLNYPGVEGYDLSVLTLPNRLETTNIHYFADLNSDPVRNGDEVRLFGFAGTQDQLSYATMTVDTTPTVVTSRYTAEKNYWWW